MGAVKGRLERGLGYLDRGDSLNYMAMPTIADRLD